MVAVRPVCRRRRRVRGADVRRRRRRRTVFARRRRRRFGAAAFLRRRRRFGADRDRLRRRRFGAVAFLRRRRFGAECRALRRRRFGAAACDFRRRRRTTLCLRARRLRRLAIVTFLFWGLRALRRATLPPRVRFRALADLRFIRQYRASPAGMRRARGFFFALPTRARPLTRIPRRPLRPFTSMMGIASPSPRCPPRPGEAHVRAIRDLLERLGVL